MTVEGFDLSVFQGIVYWKISLTKVQFAYIRCSYGNKSVDANFIMYRTALQESETPYGCYHFLNPDLDWRKQAALLASLYSGPLPPVVDVEYAGASSTALLALDEEQDIAPRMGMLLPENRPNLYAPGELPRLDKNALGGFVMNFLNEFKRLTGRFPMIYTSKGFWDGYMPILGVKAIPLWAACWSNTLVYPLEWQPKSNPKGYPPEFWQYSANGNNKGTEYGVSSRDIDLDRWYGGQTAEEFNKKYNVHISPLPSPTPQPPPVEYPHGLHFKSAITNSSVNVRTTPSAANNLNIVGSLKYPARPIAFEERVLDPKTKWVRVGSNLWCIQLLNGIEVLSYD